jgi:hypothetical protein
MESASTIIALLLVFASGLGCSAFLAGKTRKVRYEELLAYSWLLGTAFVSLATFLLGQIVLGTPLNLLVSLGGAALGGAGLWRLRARMEPVRFPRGFWEWLLFAAVFAQIAFFGWYASRQYFGWDGLAVWEVKSRIAFLNGGVPPHEFFRDPTRQWCQPSYPLFVPLVEAWVYSWVGACNQAVLRPIFPLFYVAGLIILGRGVARLTGKSLLGWAASCSPFLLPFIMRRDGGVLGGYADYPLGVYYLCGVIHLLSFLRYSSRSDLRLFAAVIGVLPWIKSEGTILWLCLSLIAVPVVFPRLGWSSLLLPLPGLGCALLWRIFWSLIHGPPSGVFLPVTPSTLVSHAHRIVPVLLGVAAEMGNTVHWGLLWLGVGLALVQMVCLSKQDPKIRWVTGMSFLFPLACYSMIYPFSAMASYSFHFWSSFPRLLLQLAPTGLLMIFLAGFDLFLGEWPGLQENDRQPTRQKTKALPVGEAEKAAMQGPNS